jgi:hypothetical protein
VPGAQAGPRIDVRQRRDDFIDERAGAAMCSSIIPEIIIAREGRLP